MSEKDLELQARMKEGMRNEYLKCSQSPEYFICNYIKVVHPIKGIVPFALFDFQKEVVKAFDEHSNNIVLKSRQMGITTLISAFILWRMIFEKNKNFLIISLKQDLSKNYITTIRFMNENLPTFLKMGYDEDNRLSLKFANGSQVQASATTKFSGVSFAVSLLVIDEAALLDDGEALWQSSLPSLSTGGNAIIASTPRGVGNWFHKMFIGAKESGFNALTLPWNLHPERDQAWRDKEAKRLGDPAKGAEEFDCSFLASGRTLISSTLILKYQSQCIDPLWKKENGYQVFTNPNPNSQYLLTVDPASGLDNGDYCAFHVLDVGAYKIEQVVSFLGKMPPTEFGMLLKNTALEFNSCGLLIERTGLGLAIIEACKNYQNLIHCSPDLNLIVPASDIRSNEFPAGFSTNIRTRLLVISKLEEILRLELVKLHDARTIDQLLTFVSKNGRFEALNGYSDDAIMALGIGLLCSYSMTSQFKQNAEVYRAMLGGITKSGPSAAENKMNTAVSPTMPYSSTNRGQGSNAWKMRVKGPNGQTTTEDISWLLD